MIHNCKNTFVSGIKGMSRLNKQTNSLAGWGFLSHLCNKRKKKWENWKKKCKCMNEEKWRIKGEKKYNLRINFFLYIYIYIWIGNTMDMFVCQTFFFLFQMQMCFSLLHNAAVPKYNFCSNVLQIDISSVPSVLFFLYLYFCYFQSSNP